MEQVLEDADHRMMLLHHFHSSSSSHTNVHIEIEPQLNVNLNWNKSSENKTPPKFPVNLINSQLI